MRIGWLLLFSGMVLGQPASDLMQSGIYAQDTTGDLDTAIRVYQQILSAGPAQRMYAPQAQLRLGECLMRKGDQRSATAAFQAVIEKYGGQAALVARAREYLTSESELLPKPWQDREVAEYRWSIPGEKDAWSISFVAPSPRRRGDETIQLSYFTPAWHSLRADVERSSMRPIAESRNGNLPPVSESGAGYAAAEITYLLRRHVLVPGLRGSLPVRLSNEVPVAMDFAVEATEEVTVPAGQFSCHRVRLSVPRPRASIVEGTWPFPAEGETLWYGTGGGRPLVKMKSGAAVGELTALRTAEPAGQTVRRDPGLGYSFVLPSDWVEHSRLAPDGQQTTIDLIDTGSDLSMRILFNAPAVARRQPLDAVVANRIRTQGTREASYSVRGQTTETTLGGRPALSWMADASGSGELGICVQSGDILATVMVRAPAAEFERLRGRFQPILDSFRLR